MSDRVRTLYLVRHAIAAERGAKWPDDTRRPLTGRGRAQMRRAVRGLAAFSVRVDVVLTSPLVRAIETAELLVEGLVPVPALVTAPALAPGQPPAALIAAIEAQPRARTFALVGHEPGLGELAAWLLGAVAPPVFKKGGVCRIDVGRLPPAGHGQLVWHATPKMLRALDPGA